MPSSCSSERMAQKNHLSQNDDIRSSKKWIYLCNLWIWLASNLTYLIKSVNCSHDIYCSSSLIFLIDAWSVNYICIFKPKFTCMLCWRQCRKLTMKRWIIKAYMLPSTLPSTDPDTPAPCLKLNWLSAAPPKNLCSRRGWRSRVRFLVTYFAVVIIVNM